MEKEENLKKCGNPECNKLVKNKYCGPSCAGKVKQKGKTPSIETRIKISLSNGGDGTLERKKAQCLNCGKHVHKTFCDNTCKAEYRLKLEIEKWLNREIDGSSPSGHATYVKKYLLKKYENKCSKCGWGELNPYSKNIPLEVEHIDGNPYNNSPENVDLICPNCHSLTATYRGANRGKGRREYLKKYYIKGDNGKII